jgi:sugar phosphate isomerase/epimerase
VPQYRIGAHTYIFAQLGYDEDAQFDEIFDIVAAAGFQAIELNKPLIGFANAKQRIDAALARTGLQLVGASNGYALWDKSQEETIRADARQHAERLAQWPGMKSGTSSGGKRFAERTEEENAQVIKMWTELGHMYRDRGVMLNFHTHGEPEEDIRLVVESVPADVLKLGPDLDWLRVGGVDPMAFVEEHADRLCMLHIRDYHLGGARTEALGEGDADYAALGKLLDQVGFRGDFVVELAIPGAEPTKPVEEMLRLSVEHLKQTIGEW